MKKMEGERPHRSGSSSSELFICFTSRPSSSSNTSSMKISSKSILSPGRTDKLREGVTTLPSSLSRRLRSNGSMKGGQSSPMFPTGSKKKGCAFETPEPSSPKVTCIGQVRVKTKKQGKKMRTRSKRRGGDGSFRKTEQIQEGQMQQQQQQECLPNRNQRWVHLPLSICEALRAFGAEFNCFVPCGGRSSCSSSNAGMESEKGEKRAAVPAGGTPPTSSCGAVFAKWLMALQESEEGKRREIGGEMVGIVGAEDEEEKERVEEKKGEEKAEVEIEEEEEEVNVCIPPRNALLLMRCRSEPLRMSSLANRFWDSPAQKEEENEDRNEEEEDEDDDEEEHDYEEAVEEEQQMEGEAKQKEDETLEKAVSAEEHENTEEEEEEEYGEAQEQKEADEEEERVENGSSGVSLEEQEKPQEDDKGKEEAQLQKPEEEGEGEKEEEETQLHKTEEEEKETQLQKIEEEKENQLQKTEEVEKEIQLQKTEEEEETHLQKTKEEEQKESQLHKTEEGEEEEEEEREEKMVEERRSSCSTASVQLGKEEEGAEAVLEEERSTEEENEKTEVITVETTEAAAAALTAAESEEEKSTVEEKRKVEGREERERALQLPDCLLLMMCEPKLSMEVSRETWVCSTDFLRCRPDKGPAPPPPPPPLPLPPPEATGKRKEGAADDSKRVSTDSNPAHPPPANPAPQQPLSMATVIEQKLVNAVAYEPFVLTRCKSEPVRSSARLAPEACFWKSRKLPPHQPPLGVGAAGVGF
ncbi:stress response protein nst1 [Magnolia sinica]|uniref:stress response protein nst1 n=1 Tax=Magnolia sinica TaxID=86752 RepID=UPI0026588513|nr:stress response protein nst1 [Magnolia sinica]